MKPGYCRGAGCNRKLREDNTCPNQCEKFFGGSVRRVRSEVNRANARARDRMTDASSFGIDLDELRKVVPGEDGVRAVERAKRGWKGERRAIVRR